MRQCSCPHGVHSLNVEKVSNQATARIHEITPVTDVTRRAGSTIKTATLDPTYFAGQGGLPLGRGSNSAEQGVEVDYAKGKECREQSKGPGCRNKVSTNEEEQGGLCTSARILFFIWKAKENH